MCTIHYLTLCTCISNISDMHTIHYLTLCTCISDMHTNYITKKLFTIQTAAWECTIQLCTGNAVFL